MVRFFNLHYLPYCSSTHLGAIDVMKFGGKGHDLAVYALTVCLQNCFGEFCLPFSQRAFKDHGFGCDVHCPNVINEESVRHPSGH